MTNKQKLKQARIKLNNQFPLQLNVFYYKGMRINRSMFFGKEC